jgi:archaellin
MTILEDGQTGKVAEVNVNNQLEVRSEAVDSSSIVAARDELYFNWQSDYSATANDFVIYIKNDDPDRLLKIRKVYLSSDSTNVTFEVHRVDTGTPAGTTITPVNLTFGSAKTALETAYGNAAVTGISTSTMMWSYYKTGGEHYLDANGAVILLPGAALAVKVDTSSTIKVYIAGYFTRRI